MKRNCLLISLSVILISLMTGCGGKANSGSADNSGASVVKGTVAVASTAPLSSPSIAIRMKDMAAAAVGNIPVPGAVCAIEGTDKKDTTDENGFFEIKGVSPGTHLLICSKTMADGYSYTFLKVLDVSSGSTEDIGTLELTLAGNIRGTATMEGRADGSGIKVFIPGTSLQATTDATGSYLIKNVPAGIYNLKFEHAGFKTVTLSGITVTTGQFTEPNGVSLAVDTGPTGSISINNGDTYSQSRTVTLAITVSTDALLMMISEDPDFVGAVWQVVAGSVDHAFDSDGRKRIYCKFSNDNGLQSGTVSDDIIVDTLPPSGASIVINNNAATVSTQAVTLTLSATDAATGVSRMLISNDAAFTGAAWEPYSSTRAWTLSDGDGTKTVYARFSDAAGNETGAVSASIQLASGTPAAGGALDTSFGTNGKVYVHIGPVSAFLFSVAVQADGKIVAGGYSYYFTGGSYAIQFLVVRFNSDGTLDDSFGGGNGMVTTNFGDWGAVASLAIQADGKIVAAGSILGGFGAARYNSDGSPDTTFGTNGVVAVPVSTFGSGCTALGLQSDGKIVLAGYGWNGFDEDMVVVRLTAIGALDTAFNGTGKVMTHAGTRHNETFALAIQRDDKIIVGGYADTAQGRNFALLRYNGDGSLDAQFGTNGLVTTALGSSQINSLAIQADGKILAGGYLENGNYWVVAVARYKTDGSIDTTFGGNGTVTTAAADWRSEAKGMKVLSSGKILVSGYAGTVSTPTDFLLIQYNDDGSLDTSFGTSGVVITDFAGEADSSNAVAVQSDGKIIAAGMAFFDSATGIALVRYQ